MANLPHSGAWTVPFVAFAANIAPSPVHLNLLTTTRYGFASSTATKLPAIARYVVLGSLHLVGSQQQRSRFGAVLDVVVASKASTAIQGGAAMRHGIGQWTWRLIRPLRVGGG